MQTQLMSCASSGEPQSGVFANGAGELHSYIFVMFHVKHLIETFQESGYNVFISFKKGMVFIMKKGKGKALIVLTGLAAAGLHLLNRYEYTQATSPESVSSIGSSTYKWRFGNISYTKVGQGTPLLLLHDLTPGSSSFEFSKLQSELSATYETYALNLLGYGSSEKPELTYTNYLYVQLITDFIKNVIKRPTIVIASGMTISAVFMADYAGNAMITRVIGINPPDLSFLSQVPSLSTRLQKKLIELPIIGTFLYNKATSRNAFEKAFKSEYFYNPYNVEDTFISAYFRAAHIPNYHSRITYASFLGRHLNVNISHALRAMKDPVCLITGEHQDGEAEIVKAYLQYNPSFQLASIPVTRKLPHLERPDATADCIRTFLNNDK